MLKQFRKILKLKIEDISSYSMFKNKSTIYFVEANYNKNKVFRYLLYLRSKGVDINSFLDEELKKEKK